jgi:hypothetical protein
VGVGVLVAPPGVTEGGGVLVGGEVLVGGGVGVLVAPGGGVLVRVGVLLGGGVLVRVGVLVGGGVLVRVGVRVGVAVPVTHAPAGRNSYRVEGGPAAPSTTTTVAPAGSPVWLACDAKLPVIGSGTPTTIGWAGSTMWSEGDKNQLAVPPNGSGYVSPVVPWIEPCTHTTPPPFM